MAPIRQNGYFRSAPIICMKTLEMMLRSHPRADTQHVTSYIEALRALAMCAETCLSCADACLAEPERLEQLRRCIRINQDCADVCSVTVRLLTRQTETPGPLVHAQLHACVLACQLCGEVCEEHAEMHDYCRICAEACHHCQERCNFLFGEISSSGTAENEDPLESPSYRP
jgi:hypothetical protein